MTSGEVVFSLCDYSHEFIREYKNPNLDQKVIDAIVVDFINYFAATHCWMDLAMYTKNLRDDVKLSKKGTVLHKDVILPVLNLRKDEYNKFGIIKSVNKNYHMNECCGKAEADNTEALKLIQSFIDGYMIA